MLVGHIMNMNMNVNMNANMNVNRNVIIYKKVNRNKTTSRIARPKD
jgi:hypothetical protein